MRGYVFRLAALLPSLLPLARAISAYAAALTLFCSDHAPALAPPRRFGIAAPNVCSDGILQRVVQRKRVHNGGRFTISIESLLRLQLAQPRFLSLQVPHSRWVRIAA